LQRLKQQLRLVELVGQLVVLVEQFVGLVELVGLQ